LIHSTRPILNCVTPLRICQWTRWLFSGSIFARKGSILACKFTNFVTI
jgi:hypothetical protein